METMMLTLFLAMAPLIAAASPVTASSAATPAPAAATAPPAASAQAPPAAGRRIAGLVYDDANRNGRRDAGEAGIAGAAVTDLRDVVVSGADGGYVLQAAGDAAVIAVSLPDGWAASGQWWRLLDPASGVAVGGDRGSPAGSYDFGLARRPGGKTFTFLHASDTHIRRESLARTQALRALVEAQKPDFVLITGDLIQDALRVGEPEARAQYDLLAAELGKFSLPVFAVPGNHDIFGIERQRSQVRADHPMYGRALCRSYVGPEYFSFTWGGIHFVGLHSVDYEDTEYFGRVDAAQLEWLRRDLARLPWAMPVVTFNHIPFVTAVERLSGYTDEPPAPTLVRVDGRMQYRHMVSNVDQVLAALGGHRLEIALGGHLHTSERIAVDTGAGRIRFHQTGAVVGPSGAPGVQFVSGATLYRARDGRIDDGTFLLLDAPATPAAR